MSLLNNFLIIVYLATSIAFAGFGKVSFKTENSISTKNSFPKHYFLTNYKLPKHLSSEVQNNLATDAESEFHSLRFIIGNPFLLEQILETSIVSCLFNSELTNKAPPCT